VSLGKGGCSIAVTAWLEKPNQAELCAAGLRRISILQPILAND
jgi:hypothetical protein